MFPPDPYGQFDQQPSSDATRWPDSQSTTTPRSPTQPPPYHEPRAGEAPLPLPYDDYDPTFQEPSSHQPPVYQDQQPSTYLEAEPVSRGRRWFFWARQPRASRGQVYTPPPTYQPVPQQQIIYVRERRPSLFAISCSILAILLLMACGLAGLAVFRGVTSGLETIPANLTMLAFCLDESAHNYSGAYQELSSGLQQLITVSNFASDNSTFDQQSGSITSCAQTSNSSDTVNGDSVTIEMTVARSGGSSETGYMTVVKQGNQWRISHIDAALNLV